jgi:hypothetical protein
MDLACLRSLLWFTAILSTADCLAQPPAGDFGSAVTLYANFQQQPALPLVEQMHAEVARILRPIGMKFKWRALDDPRASEPVDQLVIVTFKGQCVAGPQGNGGSINSRALGWAHVSSGRVLPFSNIDCDHIWRVIHREVIGSVDGHNRKFGRALGRVLAHELYHILANTTTHAREGGAKARYTARDLLADDPFHFTEREFRMIREGKLRYLSQHGTPTVIARRR